MYTTEDTLIEYYVSLPEKFIVTEGDYIGLCFSSLFYLIPDLSDLELFRFIQEISKVLVSHDLEEHLNRPGLLYSEFRIPEVFPTRDILLPSLLSERIQVLAGNLLFTLIQVIRAHQLYLPRLPNIDYTLRSKTKICYRIGDYHLERGMIILYKTNPWEY